MMISCTGINNISIIFVLKRFIRPLCAVFNTFLSFSELLALEGGVSLHLHFIQKILVEVFKIP